MSARPRLWIVDPGLFHPEQQGIAEIVRDWPGSYRVFRPGLTPGDGPSPTTGHDVDAVVVLGSAASVYDPLPWIADLAAWLSPMLSGELHRPVLGVCFGHQLIAHIAGGRVGFRSDDRAKYVGVHTTRVEGSRLLPGRHELRVVVSHCEEVQQVPAAYRVIAQRPASVVDGLEHERLPIFSVQFHPEAREEFAARVGVEPGLLDDRLREDSQLLLDAFRRLALALR